MEGTACLRLTDLYRSQCAKGVLGVKTAVGRCCWIKWSSLCVKSFGLCFHSHCSGATSSHARQGEVRVSPEPRGGGSVLTWGLGWGCLMSLLDAKRNQWELLQPGKRTKFLDQITDQFCLDSYDDFSVFFPQVTSSIQCRFLFNGGDLACR